MHGATTLLVLPLVNLFFVLFSRLCLPRGPSLQGPEVVITLLATSLTMLAIPFDEVTTAWGATSNLANVTVVNR